MGNFAMWVKANGSAFEAEILAPIRQLRSPSNVSGSIAVVRELGSRISDLLRLVVRIPLVAVPYKER
jgi:hypothetical protein